MLPDPEYIAMLVLRRHQGEISGEEEAVLRDLLTSPQHYPEFGKEVLDENMVLQWYLDEQQYREAQIEEKVLERIRLAVKFKRITTSVHRIPFLRHWWAAASLLLLLATGAYLWTTHKNNTAPMDGVQQTVDIAPGTDGAILTLADGSQLVLDSLGNGLVAAQKGAQVSLQNGQLAYNPTGETAGEMQYNTLNTPKGRQFQVVLPDGTKVWLNAASSIRYPTAFAGKERRVEITGEAYFEVAKNTQLPFRAIVNNKAEVEVLGTYFNVNAYENEGRINTTLLEGTVRVSPFQTVVTGEASENASLRSSRPATHSEQVASVVLKPGQQAQLPVGQQTPPGIRATTAKQEIRVINNADIDKVMAWKNGFIYFDGATFDEIMRQLERWYDIEVVYENNKIPNKRLAGGMTRGVSLNDLLKYLGKMGVHYQLDDRTLIVSP